MYVLFDSVEDILKERLAIEVSAIGCLNKLAIDAVASSRFFFFRANLSDFSKKYTLEIK